MRHSYAHPYAIQYAIQYAVRYAIQYAVRYAIHIIPIRMPFDMRHSRSYAIDVQPSCPFIRYAAQLPFHSICSLAAVPFNMQRSCPSRSICGIAARRYAAQLPFHPMQPSCPFRLICGIAARRYAAQLPVPSDMRHSRPSICSTAAVPSNAA